MSTSPVTTKRTLVPKKTIMNQPVAVPPAPVPLSVAAALPGAVAENLAPRLPPSAAEALETSEAIVTVCAPEMPETARVAWEAPKVEPVLEPVPEPVPVVPSNELVLQLPTITITQEQYLTWRQSPSSTLECVRALSPEDRWAMFKAEMEAAPENLVAYLELRLPKVNEGILQRCCGAMALRWAETHPEFKAALRDEENLKLRAENQRLREEAQRNLSICAPTPTRAPKARTNSGGGKCQTDEQIHTGLKERRIKDRLGITKKPTPEQRELIAAELVKERDNTPQEFTKKKAQMAKERVYSQRSYAKNGKASKPKVPKASQGGGGSQASQAPSCEIESEAEEEEEDEEEDD